MELRKTFNENARNYDKIRPGYGQELFETIFRYSRIGAGSELLEIGIGTGQATAPFLDRGCRVTAVELGEKLAAVSREKYAACPEFQVIVGDFMELSGQAERYDLIYAATAFHWLPQAAYGRVWDQLKPGGTLALFWNRPFVSRMDDPSNAASRRVYDKYRPTDNPRLHPWGMADCEPRRQELLAAGFTDVEVRLFHRTRCLSAEEYLCLLNSYSDHRALAPEIRAAFEADMLDAIVQTGGEIRIYDTMDLYLGRKPE